MKSDRIAQYVLAGAVALVVWVLLSHFVVVPAVARLLEDHQDSGAFTLGPVTFAYGGTFVAYAGWFTFGLLALVLVVSETWRVAGAPTPRALRTTTYVVAGLAMVPLTAVMPGRVSRRSDAEAISAVVGEVFTSGVLLGAFTLFALAGIFGLSLWRSSETSVNRRRDVAYALVLVAVTAGSLLVVPLL